MSRELKDKRIPIMMTASEVKAVDDWRFANRIATRSEAMRLLIAQALNQAKFNAVLDDRSEP